MKKNNSAIGSNWNDVRKKLFTPEEIAESDLRVSIISEMQEMKKVLAKNNLN